MSSSVSTLPWIWVIEALASFKQVDASILIDLAKRTPEISDDLGKNARKMVSLGISESFFARQSGSTGGGSSTDSKMQLDPSEHCEDVRDVLHKMSSLDTRRDELEMFEWGVRSFIMNKSASSPKCTLEKLKDAILEGNHPFLASLKERSGLSISNQSENRFSVRSGGLNLVEGTLEGNLISLTPEKLDGLLQVDAPNRTVLSSKRDRSDFDTEDLAAKFPEDVISMDNGGDSHLHNAKKLKQNATLNDQATSRDYVPVIENEFSEDIYRRNGQHTIRDDCYLIKSSHVGGLEESMFPEDSHEHYIALKRCEQMKDDDASGLHSSNPQISCNNDSVAQDSSGDGAKRDLSANEANDDGKQFPDMGTSYAAPIYGTHRNNCSDETRDKSERFQINTLNDAPPIKKSNQNNFSKDTKGDTEHNSGGETSSHSDRCQVEKIDLALKKQTFLSSQCTFSQDSLTTADCAELELCMKCNKGGQLLVCRGSACPLVVHQSCLGSAAPNFDDSGRFYCPFCTYSHAISEYLELKKKVVLVRSDLAVFIGLETGHQDNKCVKCFLRQEQNQFIQDVNVNRNGQSNYITEVNSSQYGGNIEDKQQVEPSVSCVNGNLPCQEEFAAINDRTLGALFEGERVVRRLSQRIEEPGGGHDGDDNNSTCRDREIVHERAEDVMQQEVSLQDVSHSSQQAAFVPNVRIEENSGEENAKSSNYAMILRRREKREMQYNNPAIPQLRRNNISWTSAEEETLKEGVRRFSSIHDRIIPWKRILEFGSDVLQKGRTTIDLKDKWRNICKGSTSSKRVLFRLDILEHIWWSLLLTICVMFPLWKTYMRFLYLAWSSRFIARRLLERLKSCLLRLFRPLLMFAKKQMLLSHERIITRLSVSKMLQVAGMELGQM